MTEDQHMRFADLSAKLKAFSASYKGSKNANQIINAPVTVRGLVAADVYILARLLETDIEIHIDQHGEELQENLIDLLDELVTPLLASTEPKVEGSVQ